MHDSGRLQDFQVACVLLKSTGAVMFARAVCLARVCLRRRGQGRLLGELGTIGSVELERFLLLTPHTDSRDGNFIRRINLLLRRLFTTLRLQRSSAVIESLGQTINLGLVCNEFLNQL